MFWIPAIVPIIISSNLSESPILCAEIGLFTFILERKCSIVLQVRKTSWISSPPKTGIQNLSTVLFVTICTIVGMRLLLPDNNRNQCWPRSMERRHHEILWLIFTQFQFIPKHPCVYVPVAVNLFGSTLIRIANK